MKIKIEDIEAAFAWIEQARKDMGSKEKRMAGRAHPDYMLRLERDRLNAIFVSNLLEVIIDDVKLSGESIIECKRP